VGGKAQLERALEYQALLAGGDVPTGAALARREGLTRARITQVMTLLRLAPKIQEQVLTLPAQTFTERELRRIAMLDEPGKQRRAFTAVAELIELPVG